MTRLKRAPIVSCEDNPDIACERLRGLFVDAEDGPPSQELASSTARSCWIISAKKEGRGKLGKYRDGEDRSPPLNAVVVRQAIEEIWNQGNLDVADTLFAAAYVNLGGLVPDLVRGPEAIKIAAALHHTAFPQLHITIERMISEGAHVAFQWVAHNQTVDAASDYSPSDSRPSLRGMTFCRLALGKIVQSWTSWDSTSVIRTMAGSADAGLRSDARLPSDLN